MAKLLNSLWFVLGGMMMGLAWWLVGLICALTIVGCLATIRIDRRARQSS